MNNTVRSAVIISGNNMRPDGTRHKKQINRTLQQIEKIYQETFFYNILIMSDT